MSEHVFDKVYTDVYDALYQDKDYDSECDFLEQVFDRYTELPVCNILDLGCGTGGHALPLAERYAVVGIDLSETMMLEARKKAISRGTESCTFVRGDIRTFDYGSVFDVVISMFAVIGYQTTNRDLVAALHTARKHLLPGGLFVFDCWFGPAVLAQKPTDRCKAVDREDEYILRYTHSTLDILQHTVRVDYRILRIRNNWVLDDSKESHLMRFLFPKEIEYFLSEAGFELLDLCSFMELGREASENDWNISVVSRAV